MKRNTLVESGDFYVEEAHRSFKWDLVKDCHSQKNQLHLYLGDHAYNGSVVYRILQRLNVAYDLMTLLNRKTEYFKADSYKMAVIHLSTESISYNTSDTLVTSETDRIIVNFPILNSIEFTDLRCLVMEAILFAYLIYFESLANVLGEKAFSTLIESVDRVEFI